MPVKRVISACLPSYFVDRVRAKRFTRELAEQQQRDKDEIERERAQREAVSWADAVARAGQYDAANLTEFRLARSKAFTSNGSLLQANVLGLVAAVSSRKDLAVTDFGGSTGELGRDFLQRYPGGRYVVVDLPDLVSRCESRDGLVFTDQIPQVCDIFYSSGTLQYLADPMAALERGMKSATRFVILRRNHFAADVVFDIQRPMLWENGDGPIPEGFPNVRISYPRQTLVEGEIFNLAGRLGFSCLLKTSDLIFSRTTP
jgi:putative methyltransferase (TIGR04325 family)